MTTRVIKNPSAMTRKDLELNYMLMAIAMAKLMVQVNQPSIRFDTEAEDPPPYDLNVNWNPEEGVCVICIVPIGSHR